MLNTFPPLARSRNFKLITFDANLHPPVVLNTDPMRRVAGIAERLVSHGADIACVQGTIPLKRQVYNIVLSWATFLLGVFHPPTRDALESSLKTAYPYIITQEGVKRQLKNSGAFFASKFPILRYKKYLIARSLATNTWHLWCFRHEFRMFGQAIGPDALLQKGVLGVKLDLSSIIPDKVLFVFSVHLQVRL